jgi:hypothetical protein
MGQFNLSSQAAAGGGADALESLWRLLSLAKEADARTTNDTARVGIERERVKNESDYKNASLKSLEEERQANAKLRAQQGADALASDLTVGQDLTPSTVQTLTAGSRGDLVKAPTLGSTNITGDLLRGQLRMAPNPGKGPTYLGTPGQQQQKSAEDAFSAMASSAPPALRGRLQMIGALPAAQRGTALVEALKEDAKPTSQPVMRVNPRTGQMEQIGAAPQGAHFVNEPAPPQAPVVMVQTVDENGNPVTRMVKKEAGASYVKPANATTATRVASAETVNEVGTDIIHKLSDPKFASVVGPALGRAGTLRDFIGNPPPEFSELAGQIESYALANMGVHGMRSTQGAEQIKKLLDAHHTPESLAATIRGLNDFSTRFVEHNKPKAAGAAPDASGSGKETPEQRIARLLGGG